jgi:transposase
MLQITPQMRVLVAVEPIDGRKGIDSLAQLCREKLSEDPFSGCLFLFRTRSRTSIRALVYDSQGFWLAQKRLSKGCFRWWPTGQNGCSLEPYQVQILLSGGDPSACGAPIWRTVRFTPSVQVPNGVAGRIQHG